MPNIFSFSYFYLQEDPSQTWEAFSNKDIPVYLEVDFWNAITHKTHTDDDSGGISRFEAQDALGEAFTTHIWGISLYQPNPLQWPLRVGLKWLLTASWEICRSSRPRCDPWARTGHTPCWQLHGRPPSLSSRGQQRPAAPHGDQSPLQPAENAERSPDNRHCFSSFLLAQNLILLWHIICD